jgi:uncharacterized protein YfdQ (DUF2303 family)
VADHEAQLSNAIKELLKTGATATTPVMADAANIPYVLVPDGFEIKSLEEFIFNRHRQAPERIKQTVSVLDPDSFIEYYNRFGDENSRTFAHEPSISVTSVLDYHAEKQGSPRWGEHQLKLTLQKSVEWTTWLQNNNKKFTQQEFGEFLEQHSLDITRPAPARMVEVARDLEGSTACEFGAGIRMQDGQVRFKYTETTNVRVGNQSGGTLDVPEDFELAIPVFVGGDIVSMKALLRFRVPEGKLSFWYTLIRPESVLREAFIAARDKIGSELGLTIINGSL